MSAVTANNATVRKTLRERSRYEVSNNSYANGIVNTLADYTVGAGPTLQFTYRGSEMEDERLKKIRRAAQTVEHFWETWCYVRKIKPKLWTACRAMNVDGESFSMLTNSSRVSMHTPISLNIRNYEADHFDDYTGLNILDDDAGVRISADGEPVQYHFHPEHPGDSYSLLSPLDGNWLSADNFIHMFRKDRSGQLRGIPRTIPALPLFSILRRYVLATTEAAETAANFAAILSGDTALIDDGTEGLNPFETMPIERNMFTTLPEGTKLAQLKAEHPISSFDDFVRAVLREIARCMGVPAVLALGDASSYNYASGRLDLQQFNRQVDVERSLIIEREFLDRLLEAWLDEALLLEGFLPTSFKSRLHEFEWSWRWPQPGHVDRAKEANGQKTQLESLTTTLASEYAKEGKDWEVELRQIAREKQLRGELGLTVEESAPQQANQMPEMPEEQAEAIAERVLEMLS